MSFLHTLLPGACAAILLAGCAQDLQNSTSLHLDAPVTPLTERVEITTTAIAPFRQQCVHHSSAEGVVRLLISNQCYDYNITPVGTSGAAIVTQNTPEQVLRYTRSETGQISNITPPSLLGAATVNLPRQTVFQGSILYWPQPYFSECSVTGRSRLRERDVIVARCRMMIQNPLTNLFKETASETAFDIQTGIRLETVNDLRVNTISPPALVGRLRTTISIR